ncbi:MAG TPA: DUF262 domain-containing HNH endonuclease family protein [Thermoanaerobaculia bacterium]|nr:DUF262 domain-containing HNH endonuclease family protein [Thermoanaerobaculia bacterium]
MNITPTLLTLHELLTKRLFRIPAYQRTYSWDSKQRRDLYSDIDRVARRIDDTHFMATVVGLRRETQTIRTDRFAVIDVVDGQQRLTTLVALLKAIEKALSVTDEVEKAVRAELQALLIKPNEVSPVILQTNHDSSRLFQTYLRDGTYPDPATLTRLADKRLLGAAVEGEAFVSDWLKNGRTLLALVDLLKNRLQFIFHEISDERLVYSVFEVLNSRGLEVSWFDRLKSVLMGIAFEAETGGTATEVIQELHTIWGGVYESAGLRAGITSEALRFAATLRVKTQPSRPLGEEEAVEVLTAAAGGTSKGALGVSTWIGRLTKAVQEFRGDPRRSAVTEVAQARLLAVAIRLRDDLTQAEQDQLLSIWEKVSFRIYGMLGKDARSKVGDYVRLAWQCENQKLPVSVLEARIRRLGADNPIEKAVEALRDENCYEEWQTQLRYFLFRYEEHLSRERGQTFDSEQWARIWADTAAKSIEHVLPQSKGSAEKSETGVFVHRLGNLVLLPPGLNSKLGAKEPDEKKAEYLKTGLAIAADVADRIPEWNREAVVKREEELLAWASTEWGD